MLRALCASQIALLLATGCVFNPYVTRRHIDDTDSCRSSRDRVQHPVDHALDNAYCVQSEFERHVSHNAYLNSIGGVTLIQLAGIASYRGMRPDNEANVTALAVGGASSYATLQWLYKKPREAIYLSGSAALACAIGEARIVLRTEQETLLLQGNALSAARAVDALQVQSGASSLLSRQIRQSKSGCQFDPGDEAIGEYADAVVKLLDQPVDVTARQRLAALQSRHRLLASAQANTARQLENLTEDVRVTVNRQLSAQQPAPEELASLLAGLKLGPLAVPDKPAPTPAAATGSSRLPASAPDDDDPRYCDVSKVSDAIRRGVEHLALVREREFEAMVALDTYDAGLPPRSASLVATPLANRCPLVRFGAPQLLSIVFTGGQSPEIESGKAVEVVVVGGELPHTVRLVSERPEAERPAMSFTAGDKDATRVTISASDDTAVGRYTFLVNDRLGASQSFQVDVK